MQRRDRGIALSVLWDDEAEGDELVWVVQREEVIPVLLVESGQWGEDKDRLAVLDRGAGGGDIVHVVVHDWWRDALACRLARWFHVCLARRGERVRGRFGFAELEGGLGLRAGGAAHEDYDEGTNDGDELLREAHAPYVVLDGPHGAGCGG